MSKRKLQDFDPVFFEVLERIARGAELSIILESHLRTSALRNEFYHFRTTLRETLEIADRVEVSIAKCEEQSRITFKRGVSKYAVQLNEALRNQEDRDGN